MEPQRLPAQRSTQQQKLGGGLAHKSWNLMSAVVGTINRNKQRQPDWHVLMQHQEPGWGRPNDRLGRRTVNTIAIAHVGPIKTPQECLDWIKLCYSLDVGKWARCGAIYPAARGSHVDLNAGHFFL